MAPTDQQVSDPIVRLVPDALSAAAGGEVVAQLHVHNPSRVVEGYTFEVLGPASDFATVTPDELSLLPDTEGTVQVVIRPPKGPDTPAGEVPVGIRCRSGVDRFHASVAEGTLTIGEVYDIESRLVAAQRKGRWRGRYVVRVVNTGNATTDVDIHPSEEDNLLGFGLAPGRLVLERGEIGRAYLTVRPCAPHLFGSPERVPFTVELERTSAADHEDPQASTELRGSFEQRAVGPARARGLVVAVLGMIGVLGALAFLLPRGTEPEVATAAPTRSSIGDLQVVSHEAVRLVWDENGTASGFRVQRLVPGSDPSAGLVEEVVNAPGDVRAVTFEGLTPEVEHCFRLVAANEIGEAAPSEPECATTPAAPVPSPSGSETPADGGLVEDPTSPEASVSETPTDAAGEGSGGAGATDDVGRPFVVFNQFQSGDIAQQGQAQQRVQELQAAGVDAQLEFTNGLEPFEDGVWLVYESGFPSVVEAQSRCDELTAAGTVTSCDVIE